MGLLKSPAAVILCPHILCLFLGRYEMLGRKARDQLELFVTGSLDQLVPEGHVLARVDRVLDLGWLREEVADCYCGDNGRPGVDPEMAANPDGKIAVPPETDAPEPGRPPGLDHVDLAAAGVDAHAKAAALPVQDAWLRQTRLDGREPGA